MPEPTRGVLLDRGYAVTSATFMDVLLTNHTLQTVQHMMRSTGIRSCLLAVDYWHLLKHVQGLARGNRKLLILGIQAGSRFDTETDATLYIRFMTECHQLANLGILQPEYVNFHLFTHNSPSRTERWAPITASSDQWVYQCPWTVQANSHNLPLTGASAHKEASL
jgi:hypothetical protein